MKCKYCKHTIDKDSIFCKYCGGRLIKDSTEISVPKPKKDASGNYYAQVMYEGERYFVKAPTEAEYKEKARRIKKGDIDVKKSSSPSLGSVVRGYIDSNTNILSPSTIRGYDTILDNQLLDFSEMLVSDINFQEMFNFISADYSPKTVKNTFGLVSAALRDAKLDVPDINLPKIPKNDLPWLDFEQIGIFLDAVKGEDIESVALLALHSLRASEIGAIDASKITEKGIVVRGAKVLDTDNQLVLKETNKSSASMRTVPIIIPRILEIVPKTGNVSSYTRPPYYSVPINRICEKANLPHVGCHGLRRSFASLAYHLKWPERVTMAVGGWSDLNTVHNIYIKLSERDIAKDVESMRDFYLEITKEMPRNG